MRQLVANKDYTIESWIDSDGFSHPNYECRQCQFSTLFMHKLIEHFAKEGKHKHVWAHPKPEGETATVTSGKLEY